MSPILDTPQPPFHYFWQISLPTQGSLRSLESLTPGLRDQAPQKCSKVLFFNSTRKMGQIVQSKPLKKSLFFLKHECTSMDIAPISASYVNELNPMGAHSLVVW